MSVPINTTRTNLPQTVAFAEDDVIVFLPHVTSVIATEDKIRFNFTSGKFCQVTRMLDDEDIWPQVAAVLGSEMDSKA